MDHTLNTHASLSKVQDGLEEISLDDCISPPPSTPHLPSSQSTPTLKICTDPTSPKAATNLDPPVASFVYPSFDFNSFSSGLYSQLSIPPLHQCLSEEQKCSFLGICAGILSKKLATKRDKEVAREAYINWFEKTFDRLVKLISADEQQIKLYSRLAKSLFCQVTEMETPVKVSDFLSCFGVEYSEESEVQLAVRLDSERLKKELDAKLARRKKKTVSGKTSPKESATDISKEPQGDTVATPGSADSVVSSCSNTILSQPDSFPYTSDVSLQELLSSNQPCLLILLNLLHTFLDEMTVLYDARSRALVCELANLFHFSTTRVVILEGKVASYLTARKVNEAIKHDDGALASHKKQNRRRRWILTGIAAAGGATLLGITAGLAAPILGAGVGAVLGSMGVTSTVAVAGTTGLITTGTVLAGGSVGGKTMANRTASVSEFKFMPVEVNGDPTVLITISGWLKSEFDYSLPFSTLAPQVNGERYTLVWESKSLKILGKAFMLIGSEMVSFTTQQILATTILHGVMSALTWPLWLTKLSYFVDNPWNSSLERAKKTGRLLAETLMTQVQQGRPVTLVGYSLGARVIAYCLLTLSKNKAYGLVDSVYLAGAPVVFTPEEWAECAEVVENRFVNGYSSIDWVLGYLYRASSIYLSSIAGCSPVKSPSHIENVDLSDIVQGHLAYRTKMPVVLRRMGFKITSDTFVEEEDFLKPKDLGESLPAMVVNLDDISNNNENEQEDEEDGWGDFQGVSASNNSPQTPIFSPHSKKPSQVFPPTPVQESHHLSGKYNADENALQLRKKQEQTRKKYVTSVEDIRLEELKLQQQQVSQSGNGKAKPSQKLEMVSLLDADDSDED